MTQDTILKQTIIEELGLRDLPREKKEKMLVKMTEVVLKRIYLETVESLSDADREELGKLLDKKAEPEKVEGFLKSKFEDYDGFVKKIVDDFKNEMKESMTQFENSKS